MGLDPFISTFTGGKAYPMGLDPDSIRIEDIAHSLANQCRYAGHTSAFWSVAAHSIVIAERLERLGQRTSVCMAGLLHDASEAYLTDVPAPIKPMFLGYREWEDNIQKAIAQRFGLVFPWPEAVHIEDKSIVADEIANFFPPGSIAWRRKGIESFVGHQKLYPMMPDVGERAYLEAFWRFFSIMQEAA